MFRFGRGCVPPTAIRRCCFRLSWRSGRRGCFGFMTILCGIVWSAGFGVPFVSNAPHIASRGIRLRPSPRRPCRHHLHKYGYGWALVPPASVGYRASLVGLAVGFDIRFVWKFCVGADRCVRPWCRQFDLWLFNAVAMRSRGGCLALVPKSPVHTFFTFVGCYTFVSRPLRSTSHLASRWQAGWLS